MNAFPEQFPGRIKPNAGCAAEKRCAADASFKAEALVAADRPRYPGIPRNRAV
jgi:hypothetical protein